MAGLTAEQRAKFEKFKTGAAAVAAPAVAATTDVEVPEVKEEVPAEAPAETPAPAPKPRKSPTAKKAKPEPQRATAEFLGDPETTDESVEPVELSETGTITAETPDATISAEVPAGSNVEQIVILAMQLAEAQNKVREILAEIVKVAKS